LGDGGHWEIGEIGEMVVMGGIVDMVDIGTWWTLGHGGHWFMVDIGTWWTLGHGGHRDMVDIGTLGHRDMRQHWDIGTMGHWDIGTLGHRDMGHWDIGT